MGTRRSLPGASSASNEIKDEISHTRNEQTDVPSQNQSHRGATTSVMLVDDVLLQIFDFYRKIHHDRRSRNFRPCPVWNWCILVHVCRRWRQIIFESPHRLNLQIFCTYGTPVRKNLGIWPALPIVLRLSSPRRLMPEDEDNAIAALEHRDRLYSVRLVGTGSHLGKMAAAMQEPLPMLTHLYMRSAGEDTSVLTEEFLGGSAPRLQEINLFRVSFPALPTLLLSTSDLVTLKLFDIPTPGYISPEQMVACLAALPRLKVLAITYKDIASSPNRIRPPPVTRTVLPVLTDFEFQGAFEYLEDLVAEIDSPRLERISIDYLHQPFDFQVTQLSDFVDRSIGPELLPSRRAHVHFHNNQVAFTLFREFPRASHPGCDRCCVAITVSLESFDWQMPDTAWALSQLSVALRTVVHLELGAEFDGDIESHDAYDVEWLDLLRQLPAMQTLRVSPELAYPVFLAIEDITEDMVAEELPSLDFICLEDGPASYLEMTWVVSTRRYSRCPITVVETIDEFNEILESYE